MLLEPIRTLFPVGALLEENRGETIGAVLRWPSGGRSSLYNFGQMRPLPDILLGYSDPPGYQLEGGPRLDNLNLYEIGLGNPPAGSG